MVDSDGVLPEGQVAASATINEQQSQVSEEQKRNDYAAEIKTEQRPRFEHFSSEESMSQSLNQPLTRNLPSLKPSGKGDNQSERGASHTSNHKPKRQQQLTKRPLQHGRSHSNTRVGLSTSSSSTSHGLSRSKSTDVIARMGTQQMKRNNKSYTKLTSLHPTKLSTNASMNRAVNGLQPLTKTTLNSSMNRGSGITQPLTKTILRDSAKPYALRKTISNGSQKGGFSTVTRNKSEISIKSNKSNTSLKGANHQIGGLKSSSKRGRAILKLNEEYPDENFEDISDDSEADEDDVSNLHNKLERADARQFSSDGGAAQSDTEIRTSANGSNQLQSPQLVTGYKTTDSSSEDLNSRNLYGGSFLLSQSTGITRKIDPKVEGLDYFAEGSSHGSKTLETYGGGLVFKAGETSNTESDPIVPKSSATKGSYHFNHPGFNNLQRNDLQFVSNMTQKRPKSSEKNMSAQLSNKNFAGFLESNNTSGAPGLETRTQQKLWLQRENSLMDVSTTLDPTRLSNFSNLSNLSLSKLMFAHNMNSSTNIRDMQLSRQGSSANQEFSGHRSEPSSAAFQNDQVGNFNNFMNIIQNVHQNSIQSRTEFERLNREYVNVRRHSNPVAASLGRIEYYLHRDGNPVSSMNKETVSMAPTKSSEEEEEEAQNREEFKTHFINTLWQDALHTSSASSVSLKKYQDEQLQQAYQQELRMGRLTAKKATEDSSPSRDIINKFTLGSGPSSRAAVKSGLASKAR